MSEKLRKAYEAILPAVSEPARYVGMEWNSVTKNHQDVDVKFCVAFPDTYTVGMSHSGLQILYGTLNRRPDVACERVFAPWTDMEKALRGAGLPLVSLESFTPLSEFDVLGFSLQYEMTYTNVLTILEMGGVPMRSEDRSINDPLVIAGGPCSLHPEPMADFIDLFLPGDGEEIIHDFIDAYRAARSQGISERRELLLHIVMSTTRDVEANIYAPSLYEPRYSSDGGYEGLTPISPGLPAMIKSSIVKNLDEAFYPDKPIVPFAEAVHDRIALEVMRGCPHRCRFCEAGHTRRPLRIRSVDKLIGLAQEMYRNTGHSEISLVSLSSADYPYLRELAQRLNDIFEPLAVNISLPSLRIDEKVSDLPPLLKAVRKSALTFAPEAGSERLRRALGKNITDADLFSAMESAYRNGWQHVKLYFMFGLPTETDEDLLAAGRLVDKALSLGRQAGRGGRINVAAAPFVPKPHTPFQWEAMETMDTLRDKRAKLGGALRRKAVTFRSHKIERSFLEGVMARGDRRVGKAIQRAYELGCRFDAWDEYFTLERWMEAFQSVEVAPEPYANLQIAPGSPLPWGHIICGPSDDKLLEERGKALAGG